MSTPGDNCSDRKHERPKLVNPGGEPLKYYDEPSVPIEDLYSSVRYGLDGRAYADDDR